jgi:hypothetical protein
MQASGHFCSDWRIFAIFRIQKSGVRSPGPNSELRMLNAERRLNALLAPGQPPPNIRSPIDKVGRASWRAGLPRWNSVARLSTIHAARQESAIPNYAPGK